MTTSAVPETGTPAGAGGLQVFRDPASVAVVGASQDPAKWGYWLARGALAGRHRRSVQLVNRGSGELFGVTAARSLAELPQAPGLVALCVPAAQVPQIVDDALVLGVRGFLVITAGIPEAPQLAARITATGARLIGPASLGLYDAAAELHLAWGNFTPGPLAIVSQSGQVGSEITQLAARAGIGISRFVSVGSQLDVTTAELLADLVADEGTLFVAVYLESFADGRRIFDAVRVLRAAGKFVCFLTAGASRAGRRATRSHTGALSSPLDLVDAACRAAGAVRVGTPSQLVDLAAYVLTSRLPAGPRVGVLSDSGGQGALAADCLSQAGLKVPELSVGAVAGLAEGLPAEAGTANPVDLAGGGESNLDTYSDVASTLLGSGDVDAVLLSGYFGRYVVDTPSLADSEQRVARELGAAVRRTGRPMLAHSMGADTATAEVLRQSGVPVFATIESAAGALAAAAALSKAERSARAVPGADSRFPRPDSGDSRDPLLPGYWGARELLSDIGVVFMAARQVVDEVALAEAAAGLRAPYVLKAAWVEHKSEVGGVRVGIADGRSLVREFRGMRERLGDGVFVVEEQDVRPDVVEVIVGARWDLELGPMVMVGAGGTEVELRVDSVTECAPVDLELASAMVRATRCAVLLDGWRGRPAVDIESLTKAIVAVSELIVRYGGAVVELEINPLRVGVDGAVAVDALLVDGEVCE
ncbi:acetate--CoA ligase family protein [Kribbella sp. NBC_00889]|uniref:acetate--CoA ligase family protein n=1 Tax=Kribbella sp. NBC_00889 TaxID=2975974 RepID=UPI0038657ECF|nr:acetate--CoA ligase family protein [Kribbella sp. NBC_00889]